MRSLPLRVLIFGGLTCTAAAGAWALPVADSARPSSVEASSYETSAPEIVLPDVGAAREVATPDAAPTTAPATTTSTVTSEPDHLVVAEAALVPEPVAVVTTTTAPPTTTTAEPVVTVAFSATQAYGSCEEPIPYDIFSGTATPGTTVSISSAYGSGSTAADAKGHWEKKVEFAGAPRGETFAVTASGLGGSTSMHFTAGGGDHG